MDHPFKTYSSQRQQRNNMVALSTNQNGPPTASQAHSHYPTAPDLHNMSRHPSDPSFIVRTTPTPRRPSEPFIHHPQTPMPNHHPFNPNSNRVRKLSSSSSTSDRMRRPSFQLEPPMEESVSIQAYAGDEESFPPHPNLHANSHHHPKHSDYNGNSHQPHPTSTPTPTNNNNSNHEDHYQILSVIRNLLSLNRRNNNARSLERQREQYKEERRTNRPRGASTDTNRALMSTNSSCRTTSGDNSDDVFISTKTSYCRRWWIPVLLLIISLTSLGISSYLLYQYFESNCAHVLQHQSPTFDAISQLPQPHDPSKTMSAHVELVEDIVGGPLKIEDPTKESSSPTFTSIIKLKGRALAVPQDGNYYVYFSLYVKRSSKSDTYVVVDLGIGKPPNREPRLKAYHTWCHDCKEDRTTLYNGGVFKITAGEEISVIVRNFKNDTQGKAAVVDKGSYLGMFLVDRIKMEPVIRNTDG